MVFSLLTMPYKHSEGLNYKGVGSSQRACTYSAVFVGKKSLFCQI